MKHRFLAAALAVALPLAAFAQHTYGGILVVAHQGDVVTVVSEENGVTQERTMTKDGKFQFRRLPPGYYTVRIRKADGTATEGTANVRPGATAKASEGTPVDVE